MKFDFEARILIEAVKATFRHRQTQIPHGLPSALTPVFLEDTGKQTQWQAFLRKAGVNSAESLPSVGFALAGFLEPPLRAIAEGGEFDRRWVAAQGCWVEI